jgi:LDH2 family malate/lactate/ureidoglycolate dehydrogenase
MDESIGHGNVLGQLAVERNREVAPMNGVACMVLIHSRIFSVMGGVLTDDFLKRSVKWLGLLYPTSSAVSVTV